MTVGESAVVVGASMAGLCAARVLADRFDRVTVLDRDTLPEDASPRGQVPQGRHPHLLLGSGARQLEAWFPELLAELAAGGAVDVDLCADLYWYQGGGVARRPISGIRGPTLSRPFLESAVRRRVAALPSVAIRDGVPVEGVVADPPGERVTAVALAGGETVGCDLMVDATGRQARSLGWIERLGYSAPEVSRVEIDTRYVTQLYRRTDRPPREWKVAAVIDEPANKRLAMALPVEGDRWMIVFGGLHGESAPLSHDERVEYARSFPSPVIAEILEASEPIGEPATHRFPASQRRHVERLRRFPLGWVLLGDAVSSFNPIYGQGMTSAAQQANVLGQVLDRWAGRRRGAGGSVDRSFSRRYFRAASRIVSIPWSIAVGGDFVYEGTTGKKPPGTDLVNRYMDRVVVAAQYDDLVALRFNEVAALLRRPETLLVPAFAARVLRSSRRGPVGLVPQGQ